MAEAQDRLNFTGSANLQNDPADPTGATLLIDFLRSAAPGAEPTLPGPTRGTITAVPTISGTFLPEIQPGTQGEITDLRIRETGVVGLPVNPFVTIGGYTFTLNNAPLSGNAPPTGFGPLNLTYVPGFGTIGFFGVSGTVTGGDYGATQQMFTGLFTAQFTRLGDIVGPTPEQVFNQVNSGGTLPVSFSAEFQVTPATVIPEPSTYLLVASGMLAIGFVGRRRRARSLQA